MMCTGGLEVSFLGCDCLKCSKTCLKICRGYSSGYVGVARYSATMVYFCIKPKDTEPKFRYKKTRQVPIGHQSVTMKLLAALLVLLPLAAAQKKTNFIDGRNSIVHLFEWKWDDIAAECEDFLAPNGYAGVQISPPHENIIVQGRPWLERYQPVSYNIISRSGDRISLALMIYRCNKAGVRVYVDTVYNHMTMSEGIGVAGSLALYDIEVYPTVPFLQNAFHKNCSVTDFSNLTNIRNCSLQGLIDLDQNKQFVREAMAAYMNGLISLGVAGFRMDLAGYIWPQDLGPTFELLDNLNTFHGFEAGSRAFIYQEVSDINGEASKRQDYIGIGNVLDFHFGLNLGVIFQAGNLSTLQAWPTGTVFDLLDSKDAVVFIDNLDNQRSGDTRILTYKSPKPYVMAIAFMLAVPYGSTPKLISSYNFTAYLDPPPADAFENLISPKTNGYGACLNGYVCEHRWRQIAHMIEFRNVVKGSQVEGWWSGSDSQIAFSLGNRGFVAFTQNGNIDADIQTGLPAGTYCDVISGFFKKSGCTGKTVRVDANGKASVSLLETDADGVLAIHVNAKL